MLILAVAVMIMLMVREYACVLACAHELVPVGYAVKLHESDLS